MVTIKGPGENWWGTAEAELQILNFASYMACQGQTGRCLVDTLCASWRPKDSL